MHPYLVVIILEAISQELMTVLLGKLMDLLLSLNTYYCLLRFRKGIVKQISSAHTVTEILDSHSSVILTPSDRKNLITERNSLMDCIDIRAI
jgi:hypothetical protein